MLRFNPTYTENTWGLKVISRHQYCNDFFEKDGKNRLPEHYLYFCQQNQNINVQDLLFAFVDILSPEWICHQGKVFIKERFQLDDIGKYDDSDSAQFWINLVLVFELYADEISRDKIDRLAALIVDNCEKTGLGRHGENY